MKQSTHHFIASVAAVCAALCLLLSGCAASGNASDDSGKPSVIATIFPGYDFARQVCGQNADVSLLIPPGSESHSYEPSAKDIIAIQNCDLFIYVGGESDTWVNQILSSMDKPVRTLKMTDCVTVLDEELKEGMEAEHEEGETHEEAETDEHVWTAPKNAALIVAAVADAMGKADTENEAAYRTGAAAYTAQLTALDTDFRAFFDTVSDKTMIFGDRFPLRYFVESYNLNYYAAFPGCAEQTEPSATTVAFLIDKVKAAAHPVVYYIEFSNHKVADSIAEATGAETAVFNSCHNVSAEQLKAGATYVSLMRNNLETLKRTMK